MDKENLYDMKDQNEDIIMSTKFGDRPSGAMFSDNVSTKRENPSIVSSPALGPVTSTITCPYCGSYVKTRIQYTTTARTHIAAAICTFICCCCCIPYCSNSAKNADHFCPSCYKYIGTYAK